MSAKPFTITEVEISRFPKANKPEEVEKSTIGAFIEECRSDRWCDVIRRIRGAETDDERRRIKTEELPVFTPSGTFSRRDKAGLKSPSGVIIADVDHLRSKDINPEELRDRIAKDPHVVMACISPSGDGVKALVRVVPDAALHDAYFRQVTEYFRKTYGVEIDPSGKDVSRAFFATHDPDLKDNNNARAMPEPCSNGSGPDFRAGAQGMDDSEKPYQWPDPQPLQDSLSPVMPITADMMPEAMTNWVIDISERLRCPLDYVATAAIVATGSVIASRVRMRPQHYNPWEVSPNLWGGIIGEPGSKKSPAMGLVFKAVDRLKIDAAESFEKERQTYKKAMTDHSAEVKLYRDAVAKLRKKQIMATADARDTQRLDQLKKKLEQLEAQEPQAPKRRRYRLNDPTIEAVQTILKDDHTCLLIDRDELTGMLAQWEMDGHQNDRPFYLESWNGLHPYDGARIGRGDFFIPNLCLSLFGGIQPPKLAQYLRNPKVCLTMDGALQRLQLLVYPNEVPPRKMVDDYENTSAKNRFFDILEKLAHADFHDLGGQSDEFSHIPWFHFSIEAKKAFEEWKERNESLVANKDGNPLLRQHFAKFDKLICGIALIFHLIALADKGSSECYIPLMIFEQALRWTEYLASHARRIYGLVENPSLSTALILGEKLKDSKIKNPLEPGFTARDVKRHHWIGLTSEDEINSALARLEDANWLHGVSIGATVRGGRPTIGFEIHPSILAARGF
jgi:hypothetical protein